MYYTHRAIFSKIKYKTFAKNINKEKGQNHPANLQNQPLVFSILKMGL